MIITRYLIKEVALSLLAVTCVLLLIFLSNQLVRYLSYAASGKIAASLVMQLMGFEIPYLLALLLPLGLYLGIILAYGRLYADSEMPVLHACGVGIGRLVFITSILASVVAGLVLVLMLWVNPLIASHKYYEISQNSVLDTLQPGRFQVIGDGSRVIYVERISRDRKQATNLFIAEEQAKPVGEQNSSWIVVSAASGHQEKNGLIKGDFIVANDGARYEGTPGQNAYKIIQFKKYAVRVPVVPLNSARQDEEAIPTKKLWRTYDNPKFAAELQWRISVPITAFILTLLAVPLSQVRPRQGRYSHLLPAMLIYIIYVNLLFVARNWVELKVIPTALGLWSVHLILFIVAVLFLVMQQRYRLRPLPWAKWGRKSA